MLEFRLLRADEIEARISQITEKGVTLLLYKDARCDMNILDETVGPLNWTRAHNRENANCIVGIWDDTKKAWITKEDTGTESKSEAEKGLASDSFKRACFNWGIGRELYSAPFCFFPANECNIVSGKCYDKFEVVSIMYDQNARKIKSVEIGNRKTGKIRTFTNGTMPGQKKDTEQKPKTSEQKPKASAPEPAPAPAAPAKEPEKKEAPKLSRGELLERCSVSGINPDWIAAKCGCNSFDELSENSMVRCLKNWKQLVAIFQKEMEAA